MLKKTQILRWLPLCVGGLAGHFLYVVPAHGQDLNNPYYAGFQNQDLAINYSYNGDGTGTFHVGASTINNYYYAGFQAAGTQGQDNDIFNGSYSLYATIAQDSTGNWDVTDGTVNIYGDLPGVSSNVSDLLLSATLTTGTGSFGYMNGSPEFNFSFTVAGGNSAIVQDFFGIGTGEGSINLNQIPTFPQDTIYSSFNNSFYNSGYAETSVVPEPALFPLTALSAAFCIFWRVGQKQLRQRSPA